MTLSYLCFLRGHTRRERGRERQADLEIVALVSTVMPATVSCCCYAKQTQEQQQHAPAALT